MTTEIRLVAPARTPIGGLMGELSTLSATALGAHAAQASLARAGLPKDAVEQCFMGCVLPAGLGQAPARQVALRAGLPQSVQAATVNKMCGSGMQAAILAHDAIRAGSARIALAGGMESMSNAPHLLTRHRAGQKFGHGEIIDHMARDGLEDAYEPGAAMGVFADRAAVARQIPREALDEFAIRSLERAQAASQDGRAAEEIAPIEAPARGGPRLVSRDEQPAKADPARIPSMRPAFGPEGRTTAANASSISDGAATLLVMEAGAAAVCCDALSARVVGHDCFAAAPADFCSAPGFAIEKLLSRIGWTVGGVDLFEVNEAFAVVPLLAARHLGANLAQVNTRGGACALGHPIGASGARILGVLMAALRERGGGRGVASICLGGGEALAMAIEMDR